jgi:hypothetical protein
MMLRIKPAFIPNKQEKEPAELGGGRNRRSALELTGRNFPDSQLKKGF